MQTAEGRNANIGKRMAGCITEGNRKNDAHREEKEETSSRRDREWEKRKAK